MTVSITPIEINTQFNDGIPLEVIVQESIALDIAIAGVGIKGDDGSTLTYLAGEDISGHSAVYVGLNGAVYKASPMSFHCVFGVTTGAVSSGGYVSIKSVGYIEMNGWSFAPNSPVFVLPNGQLSTTQDSGAIYSKAVGISISPTSMSIDIQPQIKIGV